MEQYSNYQRHIAYANKILVTLSNKNRNMMVTMRNGVINSAV